MTLGSTLKRGGGEKKRGSSLGYMQLTELQYVACNIVYIVAP